MPCFFNHTQTYADKIKLHKITGRRGERGKDQLVPLLMSSRQQCLRSHAQTVGGREMCAVITYLSTRETAYRYFIRITLTDIQISKKNQDFMSLMYSFSTRFDMSLLCWNSAIQKRITPVLMGYTMLWACMWSALKTATVWLNRPNTSNKVTLWTTGQYSTWCGNGTKYVPGWYCWNNANTDPNPNLSPTVPLSVVSSPATAHADVQAWLSCFISLDIQFTFTLTELEVFYLSFNVFHEIVLEFDLTWLVHLWFMCDV